YPTGTCLAGNGGGRSSRGNVASSFRMAAQDASPACDSEHRWGRAPGWGGMGNPGEALLNVVLTSKRKMLTRLAQPGTGSSPAVSLSAGADGAPPANRRDLTHPVATTERGKPVASPDGRPGRLGQRLAREAHRATGRG